MFFQSGRSIRCAVDDRQRAKSSGLHVADRFRRVVHGGVDVLADELDRNRAAALERDVVELQAELLLKKNRDDLVFLLRTGAAHGELSRGLLDRVEILGNGLVGRVGVHPEAEIIERHPGDRGHVPPVEGNAGGQRRGEQVVEGDDDDVRVALLALHIHEAFRACSCGLIDNDEGLGGELVLGDDRCDEPSHDVRAAAGTCRDDELDGHLRLPGFCCAN